MTIIAACGSQHSRKTVETIQLSKEAVHADFKLMTAMIETRIPYPYTFTEKSQYDSVKAAIEANISTDMSTIEVFRLFYPLVKTLNDIQIAIQLPDSFSRDSMIYYFPIRIKIQDGSVLVDESLIELQKGQEITAINGIPVQQLLHQLNAGMTYTKEDLEYRNAYLSKIFYKKIYDVCGLSGAFTLTVDSVDIRIAGKSIDQLQARNSFIQCDILEDQFAYLRIHSLEWGDFAAGDSVGVILQQFFQHLEALRIDKLILDVRGLTNGNPSNVADIMDYLTMKSYSIIDSAVLIKDGELLRTFIPTQEPGFRKAKFQGQIICLGDILTSGGGYLLFQAIEKNHIGTCLGMKKKWSMISSQQQEVLLRHSGLTFKFPTVYYPSHPLQNKNVDDGNLLTDTVQHIIHKVIYTSAPYDPLLSEAISSFQSDSTITL